uniref:Uncharacterized protein n=1 Tax=viral metagenome TaxID=1070528 RepID=A0A6C0C8P5_9ZZZZ
MDSQKDYEALEEKQTYTILCCFKTDNPQNIFVRSPYLNRCTIDICIFLQVWFAIVVIECVIVFGGWELCRLTPNRLFCSSGTSASLVFAVMANIIAFAVILLGAAIVAAFIFMTCAIINVNDELKNDPKV